MVQAKGTPGSWQARVDPSSLSAAHGPIIWSLPPTPQNRQDSTAIGIVRGERPVCHFLPTLRMPWNLECAWNLFPGKNTPKRKTRLPATIDERYPGAYIIPEGGGGGWDRGSEEILRRPIRTGTPIFFAPSARERCSWACSARIPGPKSHRRSRTKGNGTSPLDHRLRPRRHPAAPLISFRRLCPSPQPLLDFMNRFYQETGFLPISSTQENCSYGLSDSISRRHVSPALATIDHPQRRTAGQSVPAAGRILDFLGPEFVTSTTYA